MQLLPLVEMYCKWELEEDCSDLRALMFRFDSEEELNSHELGRTLLFMLRDDDVGHDIFPHRDRNIHRSDPFEDIRERLQAADLAIHGLQSQVPFALNLSSLFEHIWKFTMTPMFFVHKHISGFWLSTLCAIFRLHYYMFQ